MYSSRLVDQIFIAGFNQLRTQWPRTEAQHGSIIHKAKDLEKALTKPRAIAHLDAHIFSLGDRYNTFKPTLYIYLYIEATRDGPA